MPSPSSPSRPWRRRTILQLSLVAATLFSITRLSSVNERYVAYHEPVHMTLTTPAAPTSISSWLEESTILVTLAFGPVLTKTHLLERWIYSIRTNGQWEGPLFVLTDQVLTGDNQTEMFQDVIFLLAKPEDLHPTLQQTSKEPLARSNETKLVFAKTAMRFKRFKTLILDYLDEYYSNHPLSAYRLVLYLDVEIVVARPLLSFLQDYQDQMMQRDIYTSAGNDNPPPLSNTSNTSRTVLPYMSFFSDCPKCGGLNGGAFLLHRQHSRSCLKEWNHLFGVGADYVTADQRYMVVMKQQQEAYSKHPPETNGTGLNLPCQFWQLPDHHRSYPTRRDMRLKLSTTIVHVTNTYMAKKVPRHVQQNYFCYLLQNLSHCDELGTF